tara:strand:- start:75 stop:1556 length:1482 start_codon:yes stop_codon:yes gene_type:complete
MDQSEVISITLIFYQIILISIGIWTSRKIVTNEDFLLGGKQLGPWVAGLSYAASTSSAWVLLGFSGFVFLYGYSALWLIPGIWAGYIFMWLVLGPSIRKNSKINNWITPTDFISANLKENDKRNIAILSACLISFCFIFYIAAQFEAAADTLSSNFDFDQGTGLVLGSLIILIYCLMGGFWAASLTDSMQAIVMVFAAISVSWMTYHEAGGYQVIVNSISSYNQSYIDWFGGQPGFLWIGFILGAIGIGLGTFGQPHLLTRLMAVKGDKELSMGFRIAFIWVIIIYIAMAVLGLSARSLLGSINPDKEIFYLLAENVLPPVFAGIVIASVLSAIMSTVDSLLLASSSAISHDLQLRNHFPINELIISRIVMALIVFVAVIIAWLIPDGLFNRVLFAWSALGAAFGAIVVAMVLGFEPTYKARKISILTGFFCTVLFYTFGASDFSASSNVLIKNLHFLSTLPGDPFERFIPFFMSCIVIFLYSDRTVSVKTEL